MLKRNCAVKYVDKFGIEHTVRVEAESLFEAAICGLQRLESSFEGDLRDRLSVTVEVCTEETTYAAMVEKLKPWIHSQESPAQEVVNPGRLPLPSKSVTRNLIREARGQARRFH